MPRYLFVRRDGWTRYIDVDERARAHVVAEPESNELRRLRDLEQRLAQEDPAWYSALMATNPPTHFHGVGLEQRIFRRVEIALPPWARGDGARIRQRGSEYVFLEEGLGPEEFMANWRNYST